MAKSTMSFGGGFLAPKIPVEGNKSALADLAAQASGATHDRVVVTDATGKVIADKWGGVDTPGILTWGK